MQDENRNVNTYKNDDGKITETASYYGGAARSTQFNRIQPNGKSPTVQNNDKDKDKAGLFDGISKAQVLAGAMASVTSMLLSSKIGIAGSVIGVAIGSIVSTVASTVYKNILNNSANALKNASVFNTSGNDMNGNGNTVENGAAGGTNLDKTSVDIAMQSYLGGDNLGGAAHDTASPRIAPDSLIEKNAERRKRQLRNKVIAFSVIASLVAVAVTAILITAFTGGEGIGRKTDPILPQPSSQRIESDIADEVDTPAKPHIGKDAPVTDESIENSNSNGNSAGGKTDSSANANISSNVNGANSKDDGTDASQAPSGTDKTNGSSQNGGSTESGANTNVSTGGTQGGAQGGTTQEDSGSNAGNSGNASSGDGESSSSSASQGTVSGTGGTVSTRSGAKAK